MEIFVIAADVRGKNRAFKLQLPPFGRLDANTHSGQSFVHGLGGWIRSLLHNVLSFHILSFVDLYAGGVLVLLVDIILT